VSVQGYGSIGPPTFISLTQASISSPSLSFFTPPPLSHGGWPTTTRVAKRGSLALAWSRQVVELGGLGHPDAAASSTLTQRNLTVRLGGADLSVVYPVPVTKCGQTRWVGLGATTTSSAATSHQTLSDDIGLGALISQLSLPLSDQVNQCFLIVRYGLRSKFKTLSRAAMRWNRLHHRPWLGCPGPNSTSAVLRKQSVRWNAMSSVVGAWRAAACHQHPALSLLLDFAHQTL